jgi:UDP-N-acetylglucosamine transferase subunit ALG13
MIFVTVGAQMAFDRLVRTVDCWAGKHGRNDVFAQVGQTSFRPANIRWTQFLNPEEHKRWYETAEVIVAHAGTGSILTALQLGKPILIMPRRASLHETRNDHQIATSEQFRCFDSVAVALDEEELMMQLSKIDGLRGRQAIQPHASYGLLEAIGRFVNNDKH